MTIEPQAEGSLADPEDVNDELADDARRLSSALAPWDPALSDLYDELADDLDANEVGGRWRRADITRLLLPSRRIAPPGPSWRLTMITVFRDALIFAPVAFTWWALSEASRAYAAVVQSSSAPQAFLTEWQAGFDGHVLSLGTVAQLDAVLIAAVAVLTALERYSERQRASRYSHAIQRLDTDAVAVLMELPDVPDEPKQPTLAGIGRLTTAIERNVDEAEKQREAASALRTTAGLTANQIASVVEALRELAADQKASAASTEQIAAGLTQLEVRNDALTHLIDEYQTELRGAAADIRAAASELSASTEVVREYANLVHVLAEDSHRLTAEVRLLAGTARGAWNLGDVPKVRQDQTDQKPEATDE